MGFPAVRRPPSLPMKREWRKSFLRCELPTMKFVCPKIKWKYDIATKNPSVFVNVKLPTQPLPVKRCFIFIQKKLLAYLGAVRGTEEWDCTYKNRVNVEKPINHFKDSFYVARRKTLNEKNIACRLTACRNYTAYYSNWTESININTSAVETLIV